MGVLRSKTQTIPQRISPIPERYVGSNHPYRGTESHGVEDTNGPVEVPGFQETDSSVRDTIAREGLDHENPGPDPVLVALADDDQPKRQARPDNNSLVTYTLEPGRAYNVAPANPNRDSVMVTDLSTSNNTIYVGRDNSIEQAVRAATAANVPVNNSVQIRAGGNRVFTHTRDVWVCAAMFNTADCMIDVSEESF